MKNLFYISISFLLFSCSEDFDQAAYVNERVELKYESFLAKAKKDCIKKAELAAAVHVDTIINQWINEDVMDTVVFPDRPHKPSEPDHIIEQWSDPKNKSAPPKSN